MRHTGIVGEVLCPVLVGRRAETRALDSALAGALAGQGGCAVITGEAGIGKSRLIRELARMAADRQVLVVMGRAVPASTSAPYRPVTEALLQLLRRRPLPDDPSLTPWLPHLAVLLPGAVVGSPAARLGRGVDSQAVRGEAVLRLLRRLGPDGLVVPWRICIGRTPIRCPWSNTWPTTPSASLSCSPSPSVPVSASRWPMARHHIEAAVGLAADGADPNFSARAAVLSAEVTLAGDDLDGARRTAEQVLAMDSADPDVRCHALAIVGRSRRLHDLPAAAAAFGAALATAEQANLPVWRLRALHELGTVDMFERMDTGRLLEARQLGEQMGALSTVAVLDLQLSAIFTARWDLQRCDAHAGSALDIAGHLRLDQVAAKALAVMAGSASMRADVKATERLAARVTGRRSGRPHARRILPGQRGHGLVHGR